MDDAPLTPSGKAPWFRRKRPERRVPQHPAAKLTPTTLHRKGTMTTDRPLVLLRPDPQQLDRIFDEPDLKRLHAAFRVVELGTTPQDEERLDELLPEAFAV